MDDPLHAQLFVLDPSNHLWALQHSKEADTLRSRHGNRTLPSPPPPPTQPAANISVPIGPPAFRRWCSLRGGLGPLNEPPALPSAPGNRTNAAGIIDPLNVTPCFQVAVVNNVPFLFLAIAATWRLLHLARRSRAARRQQQAQDPRLTAPLTSTSMTHLSSKLIAVTGLAVVEYLSHLIETTAPESSVDLTFAVFHTILLAVAFALTCLDHTRSRRSSDVLLITWFLYTLASALGIYTSLIHPVVDDGDESTVVVSTLALRIASASFSLLAFLLELAPKHYAPINPAAAVASSALAQASETTPLLSSTGNAYSTVPDAVDADLDTTWDSLEAPETTANIFSRLTFWWLTPLLWRARRSQLSAAMLWNVPATETTDVWYTKFKHIWQRETHNNNELTDTSSRLLMRVCILTFGPYFALGAVLKLAQDTLQFMQPQLLRRLINYQSQGEGVLIACGMLVAALTQSLLINQYFQLCMVVGQRIRAAMSAAIYHKALRLSLAARGSHSSGQLASYLTVDVQKLSDLCTYLHIMWSGPFQIALALYFLFQQLGPAVLAGLAVMLLMLPVNAAFAKRQQRVQKDQMRCRDQRLRLMDEFLSGIRVVKLYAWELYFLNRIDHCRQRELRNLKKNAYLSAASGFTWMCTPFMVALASFAVYTLIQGQVLTPENTFVSLALFNLLQFPIAMFPNVFSSCVEASVSLRRIHAYLTMPEVHPAYLRRSATAGQPARSTLSSVAIRIKGSFAWSKPHTSTTDQQHPSTATTAAAASTAATLKDLDLTFLSRELVAVVGKVGSGKSSLLSAILGEMEVVAPEQGRGEMPFAEVHGKVAYVADDAWILNATIRENILFGLPMDQAWYERVLAATALDVDLLTLPNGDNCLVGEQGVGLSGGQQKRLTLARAVYSRRDIILCDDPLSALDVHVAKHVFHHCFSKTGLLANKCRILVTHQVHLLKECDVIVNFKDGQVSEMGNYRKMVDNKGDVYQLLMTIGDTESADEGKQDEGGVHHKKAASSSSSSSSSSSPSTSPSMSRATLAAMIKSSSPTKAGKDVKHMSMIKNSTTASTCAVTSAGAATPPAAPIANQLIEAIATGSVSWHVYALYFRSCQWKFVFAFLLATITTQALQITSNVWLEYVVAHKVEAGRFLSIYALIFMAFALASVTATLTAWIFCGIRAAHALHDTMLSRLAAFPMSFFDVTPNGRVLNRFGKDINTIDESLPRAMMAATRTALVVVGVVVVISSFQPLFLLAILPLGLAYKAIQALYLPASRDIKRIESVSRSPILAHFSETVSGVHVVRAFQDQDRFVREFHARVDFALKSSYLSLACNRWLASRLEWCGAGIVFATAVLMVKSGVSASVIGLTLSYALSVTGSLTWSVRQFSEVETQVVSVERIAQYCDLETEAPALLPTRPSALWPERGEIVFENYSTRYRPGLDLVLDNVSFEVKPGEKIGIVGRTGSGKSSLLLALFRVNEPVTGRIRIDGIDTRQVGLYDLRSRITIIPQSPLVFSGTVRSALDPLGLHDDFALWEVLDAVQLKSRVMHLPDKLSHVISHGGTFSMGERQLICLGRALLRQTQILVCDEATAQIDVETDAIIQRTIRERFAHATVLTIAHRILSVLDSDRVLVLDSGHVVEYDSPSNLLQKEDSYFRKLVEESGLH
ncbi:hypothetical protein BCR44DRAFT_1268204 [Catenaria anguillulae PL171]|uniref:P-loop containing nucleoside triphosphate hydrolase protein n=1 Tax=Catenaria anguillulae PL171 TaxID=765915 RepID=A0A1Y2HX23_9FUNG|nr:hypothetical protein BCR44DRAFT_1268204 [Catenaria anguillulae PL171]